MNKKTKEIIAIEQSTSSVVLKAEKIEIVDTETLTEATSFLTKANQYLDSVVKYKKKKTDPLNQALKIIRAETKPIETALETAIDLIREKMSVYQTSLVQAKQDAEKKIAERIGEGRGKLSMESAVKRIEAIEKPVDLVTVEEGAVKFRVDKRLKIVDESLIPREYLIADEKKILEALKGGAEIAGVEIEEISVPVNYRA